MFLFIFNTVDHYDTNKQKQRVGFRPELGWFVESREHLVLHCFPHVSYNMQPDEIRLG